MWWLLVVALSAAIVAVASLGAWQFVAKSAKPPPPVADSAPARDAVIEAAKANAVKVLSYKWDTLDRDVAAAEAGLTGDFLKNFKEFTSSAQFATVRQQGITATATAVGAAVSSLAEGKAEIILFLNQTRTSRDQSSPQATVATVRVGMTEVDGKWLIEKLDPL
jgi:Mce-associated membrane protein